MNAHHLELRALPSQSRASKTVDLILSAAAKLLEESGFEELTTNKICKAAGLTPPALYRYFPNKYAVVCELARQLMLNQNLALAQHASQLKIKGLDVNLTAEILTNQVRVTREFVGGVAVLKTMYATPQLVDIRLASHDNATDGLTEALLEFNVGLPLKELRRRVRLIVEIGNSVIEMVIENPSMDEVAMIRDTADMMHFLLTK